MNCLTTHVFKIRYNIFQTENVFFKSCLSMQYIQAVENGADLVRCRDEDSQANYNILAGEERATCDSKIKILYLLHN